MLFLYHFYFLLHCTYTLDFQNSDLPPSKFSQFFFKNQIVAYFYVDTQNLVKIGRSTAELLRIFDFQNGDRLPSWIFLWRTSSNSLAIPVIQIECNLKSRTCRIAKFSYRIAIPLKSRFKSNGDSILPKTDSLEKHSK